MSLTAQDLDGRFPSVTAHLSPREIEALAATLSPLELPAGTMLISEGHASDTLYFLARGELLVSIDVAGTPRPVGRLEPGALVGEVSLMDPGPASATVISDGDATVYALTHSALDGLARGEPHVAAAILKALCRVLADRIRAADDRTSSIIAALEGGGDPGDRGDRGELASSPEHHGLMEWFRVRFGSARR